MNDKMALFYTLFNRIGRDKCTPEPPFCVHVSEKNEKELE